MPSSSPRSFKNATAVCLALAVTMLSALAAVMRGNLWPDRADGLNAPQAIWWLAFGILAAGLVRASYEVWWLDREWQDLDLLGHNSTALHTANSRTTSALRHAAVEEAIQQRRVEREFRQSQRALAASHLSSIGSITRFGSSTLLVLAVMGTFAGMRGALPGLNAAIAAAGQGAGSAGAAKITGALGVVVDTFGSNFLALAGSLVLALVAFGANHERRSVLTHLEHLSERVLYRRLPADADASELQKAVMELQRSVSAVAEVGHAVDRMSTGIGELKSVLRDTLQEMHTSFSDSVQRHGVRLQQELNATVGELVATVSTTSTALQTTAVAYEGLVRGLEERDVGLRGTTAALIEYVERLTVVEERAATATSGAARATEQAAEALGRIETLTQSAVGRLADSARAIGAAVEAQDAQVGRMDAHLRAFAERQQALGSTVESGTLEIRSAIGQGVAAVTTALDAHTAAADASSRRLGETIAAGVRAGVGTLERRLETVEAGLLTRHQETAASTAYHASATRASLEARLDAVATSIEGQTQRLQQIDGQVASLAPRHVEAVQDAVRVLQSAIGESGNAVQTRVQSQLQAQHVEIAAALEALQRAEAPHTARVGAGVIVERRRGLGAFFDYFGRRTDPRGQPAPPPAGNGNGSRRPGSPS